MARMTIGMVQAELAMERLRVREAEKHMHEWKAVAGEARKALDVHAEEYAKERERAEKAEAAICGCAVIVEAKRGYGPAGSEACGKNAGAICDEHLEAERKAANDYAESLKREIDSLRAQLRTLGRAVEHEDLTRSKLRFLASEAVLEGNGWTMVANTQEHRR